MREGLQRRVFGFQLIPFGAYGVGLLEELLFFLCRACHLFIHACQSFAGLMRPGLQRRVLGFQFVPFDAGSLNLVVEFVLLLRGTRQFVIDPIETFAGIVCPRLHGVDFGVESVAFGTQGVNLMVEFVLLLRGTRHLVIDACEAFAGIVERRFIRGMFGFQVVALGTYCGEFRRQLSIAFEGVFLFLPESREILLHRRDCGLEDGDLARALRIVLFPIVEGLAQSIRIGVCGGHGGSHAIVLGLERFELLLGGSAHATHVHHFALQVGHDIFELIALEPRFDKDLIFTCELAAKRVDLGESQFQPFVAGLRGKQPQERAETVFRFLDLSCERGVGLARVAVGGFAATRRFLDGGLEGIVGFRDLPIPYRDNVLEFGEDLVVGGVHARILCSVVHGTGGTCASSTHASPHRC